MNDGFRRLVMATFFPLSDEDLKSAAAGHKLNVWQDPGLWRKGSQARSRFGDERFAVACLAHVLAAERTAAATVCSSVLAATSWPGDVEPPTLSPILDGIADVLNGAADPQINVVVELPVFELAKGATELEQSVK